MSVFRVMGAETEYGVHTPGHSNFNATWLSTLVVDSYGQLTAQKAAAGGETRWDYTDEDPLADARGWTVSRDEAHPSQLTDVEGNLTAAQIALEGGDIVEDVVAPVMNMVLGNGARLYVDHAHPEYSSPEVTNPLDAIRWDAAGDLVAVASLRAIAARPDVPDVNLYKNNTDNKSVSYGSHENYLMPRSTQFSQIVEHLTGFFVTRSIMCGAGRVGIGQDGSGSGFQISQRADFFEAEVGLETTIRRPIINTRDEPHATATKYRRLHVIVGDANLAQYSNFLKFGTTALVLDMIDNGVCPAVRFADPVQSMRDVSHDWKFEKTHKLDGGTQASAVELQRIYLEAAKDHVSASAERLSEQDLQMSEQVISLWQEVLDALERDPLELADRLDWVAKLSLMLRYKQRDSLPWTDPRLALIDLQWHDVRPEKGLYYKLLSLGKIRRLISDESIIDAVSNAPTDTRAYFRGECIKRFGANVVGASWDSIIFELPEARRLQRVPCKEPLRGTKALTEQLFESSNSASELISSLGI